MIRLLQRPTSEPVTLSEAKNYIKVDEDITEDDALITEMISSARKMLEDFLGIALNEQKWLFYEENPPKTIYLPRAPIKSLDSVLSGNTAISVVFDEQLGTVTLNTIPPTIRIEYTAGYEEVPKDLKQAILKIIAYMYDNRSESIPITLFEDVKKYKVIKL